MAEENQQEKTETATPKRREEARKKGQVAKSIEINTAIILFISFIFIYFYGGYFLNKYTFGVKKISKKNWKVIKDNLSFIILSSFWLFALINPVFKKYDYGAGFPLVLLLGVIVLVLIYLEFKEKREKNLSIILQFL